jgi:hypothetical protein
MEITHRPQIRKLKINMGIKKMKGMSVTVSRASTRKPGKSCVKIRIWGWRCSSMAEQSLACTRPWV